MTASVTAGSGEMYLTKAPPSLSRGITSVIVNSGVDVRYCAGRHCFRIRESTERVSQRIARYRKS